MRGSCLAVVFAALLVNGCSDASEPSTVSSSPEPASGPTPEPTLESAPGPLTVDASPEPTLGPTPEPTLESAPGPLTVDTSPEPTLGPTPEPTLESTLGPLTVDTSPEPTLGPTPEPTLESALGPLTVDEYWELLCTSNDVNDQIARLNRSEPGTTWGDWEDVLNDLVDSHEGIRPPDSLEAFHEANLALYKAMLAIAEGNERSEEWSLSELMSSPALERARDEGAKLDDDVWAFTYCLFF